MEKILFFISKQDGILDNILLGITDDLTTIRISLPTKESVERKLASCQWEMIAWTANGGEVVKKGWYIRDWHGDTQPDETSYNDGNVMFKTKELCQQAYEENKKIVHQMLGIKTE